MPIFKKILFILDMKFDPEGGGVQKSTAKLTSFFQLNGFICAVAAPGIVELNPSTKQIFFEVLSNKDTKPRLEEIIDIFQPDIIINQVPHNQLITRSLRDISEINKIFIIGCMRNTMFSVKNDIQKYVDDIVPLPKWLRHSRAIKFLAWKFHFIRHRSQLKTILNVHDKFLLLTEANREELQFFVGKHLEHKVKVIPNSIPAVFPDSKKENVLLYVGRLARDQKRSQDLIPLWMKVKDRMPDWEFIVVGDGPLFNEIEEYINENNIDRIRLLGKSDPTRFYSISKIFIMTSSFEGFPNVLIEGMSFGSVPVCFNSYGAISQIMTNGREGFLINEFDVDEMASKVFKLVENEELREGMSSESLSTASNYLIEKVGNQWLGLFNEHFSD